MTAAEAVIERLEQISALTSLVSDRIYNDHAPQDGRSPYIIVRSITPRLQEQHLRGLIGRIESRIQVDFCVAERDSADAKGAATSGAAVVFGDGNGPNASGLCGWIGDVGGSPPAARVNNVRPAGSSEYYYPDELRTYCSSQDFMLDWHLN